VCEVEVGDEPGRGDSRPPGRGTRAGERDHHGAGEQRGPGPASATLSGELLRARGDPAHPAAAELPPGAAVADPGRGSAGPQPATSPPGQRVQRGAAPGPRRHHIALSSHFVQFEALAFGGETDHA